jgi:HEPN domain-containing protein
MPGMHLRATESDAAFDSLRARAAPLDKYYIPTRYPNGLPGGIPSEAFDEVDARRALELAEDVIQFVENRFPSSEETAGDVPGERHG